MTIDNIDTVNTDILDTVDKCIPVVNDIIYQYCIDNNINENDILPNVWNDILYEIYLNVFKDNDVLLKYTPNINNAYNQEVVLDIYYRIYKRICNKHNKMIAIKPFCEYMLGINRQTMYDWLNSPGIDIIAIINSDNEASLEGLLQDKSMNPMKVLPSLNHRHNWNEGSGHVTIEHKKAQSVAQLPSFGGSPGLPGGDADI